jgi:hypothetical protein
MVPPCPGVRPLHCPRPTAGLPAGRALGVRLPPCAALNRQGHDVPSAGMVPRRRYGISGQILARSPSVTDVRLHGAGAGGGPAAEQAPESGLGRSGAGQDGGSSFPASFPQPMRQGGSSGTDIVPGLVLRPKVQDVLTVAEVLDPTAFVCSDSLRMLGPFRSVRRPADRGENVPGTEENENPGTRREGR